MCRLVVTFFLIKTVAFKTSKLCGYLKKTSWLLLLYLSQRAVIFRKFWRDASVHCRFNWYLNCICIIKKIDILIVLWLLIHNLLVVRWPFCIYAMVNDILSPCYRSSSRKGCRGSIQFSVELIGYVRLVAAFLLLLLSLVAVCLFACCLYPTEYGSCGDGYFWAHFCILCDLIAVCVASAGPQKYHLVSISRYKKWLRRFFDDQPVWSDNCRLEISLLTLQCEL